jgi:hypothetical protein
MKVKQLLRLLEEEQGEEFKDFSVTIKLVDGEEIRSKEIEFTMGAHMLAYPDLVPEGEIWLDSSLGKNDLIATAKHEFTEMMLMKFLGVEYDKAHDMANEGEVDLRGKLDVNDE